MCIHGEHLPVNQNQIGLFHLRKKQGWTQQQESGGKAFHEQGSGERDSTTLNGHSQMLANFLRRHWPEWTTPVGGQETIPSSFEKISVNPICGSSTLRYILRYIVK
jgi:hypothetical protein